jgi:hypothetical protein
LLAPALYQALISEFGEGSVDVKAEDEPMLWRVLPGEDNRWETTDSGQYFAVNCPHCSDTRKRLWINHQFGQPDVLDPSKRMYHLLVCYNESCFDAADRQQAFFSRLFDNRRGRGRFAPVEPPVLDSQPFRLKEVSEPGFITPIDELASSHPAARYLDDRLFDRRELSSLYGVGFVTEAYRAFNKLSGRIYIPIVFQRKLVAWQGRYPAELSWQTAGITKYYNLPSMKKKALLYNFDQAKEQEAIVVVEGCSSAWAAGVSAVAVLGKTISNRQSDLLASKVDPDKPIAVVLDETAQEEAAVVCKKIREKHSKPCNVFCVKLPRSGTDPADYDREYLHQVIADTAKRSGVLWPLHQSSPT